MAATSVLITPHISPSNPKKIIIDTDPGIDDAMAIFLAFNSPELEVVGITTIFGNVRTPTATSNALHLCEFAGRSDVPVAQGESKTLKGLEKVRVADFVHGSDGLGNTNQKPPSGSPVDVSGPEFLVEKVNEFPGELTVVALGPLTNIAKALEIDPSFPQKVGQIIVLGGAFFVNGNVNPASEANIFGDPEAADVVFASGADIIVIGINITHQIIMTERDLDDLKESSGPLGHYIHNASQFYLAYHKDAYGMNAIYLHDPATMVASFRPDLFTFLDGPVRVQTEGITRGLTLVANSSKVWAFPTSWCGRPHVKVATSVDSKEVCKIVKDRLTSHV